MVTEGRRPGTVRSFLDSTQYSTTSILRYERIFGSGFVSTGGLETTKVRRPGRLSAQPDANPKDTLATCPVHLEALPHRRSV